MNRIDRLFVMLLAIQGSKRIRGQDLAERFEVSKRTIYSNRKANIDRIRAVGREQFAREMAERNRQSLPR